MPDKSIDARLARIEERLAAFDRALELQANEYARRLNELNSAHERAERAQQATVPRELCEVRHRDLSNFRDHVNKELDQQRGRSIGYSLAMGLVIVIVTVLLRLSQGR